MIAYADHLEIKNDDYEEVDASDYSGAWYQAFIISKSSNNILVHFSGSFSIFVISSTT